jgi:hypothetical protein
MAEPESTLEELSQRAWQLLRQHGLSDEEIEARIAEMEERLSAPSKYPRSVSLKPTRPDH